MTITSLKDLDKLITLCRKRGVQSIKVDGIEFHLGAEPRSTKTAISTDYSSDFPEANIPVPQFTGDIEAPTTIPTEELSPDQLMFYSARPEGGEAEGQQ